MRRIALALAMVGFIGLGMAGTAAQAHDYGRVYHPAYTQVWHGRHDWRVASRDHRFLPRVFFEMFHR
jgi:hypothetical protein